MKRNMIRAAALACAMVAVAGCVEPMWESGQTIRFGAGSVSGPKTRTAYGQIVDGTPKVQMVDWVSGDVIRITSAQATVPGGGNHADYKTGDGVRYGSTAESRTTLTLNDNNADGLKWGSTSLDHVFYAVYPSPDYFNDGNHSLASDGDLKGEIPAVQPAVSVSGPTDNAYVAAPDMKNQYLAAKRTVEAGKQSFEDDEVFLYFTPITTAIEFEVTNRMGADLAIDRIELESATRYLSGVFISNLAGGISLTGLSEVGGTVPSVQSFSSNTNQAAVTFGTDGLTLEEGQKLTFTIFLLPEYSLNDLTFRIVKKGEGAGFIQTALKSDASTWISFERGLKHFVKGLFVQEGAKWAVCFDPQVFSWDVLDDVNANLDEPALAVDPTLCQWEDGINDNISLDMATIEFRLQNAGDETQTFTTPGETGYAPKNVVIVSSLNEMNQPWTIKSVNGTPAGGTTYTIPGVLKIEKNGGNLKLTDMRTLISNGDHDHWTTSGSDWYKADWSSTYASSSSPLDLSKYDFAGDEIDEHDMTTANCYVVRHAGTYKIPLVYGNAVDNTKAGLVDGNNVESYSPTLISGGTNGLTPFVNHLGYGITDPFIENNNDDGSTPFDESKRLVAESAMVVWQDTDESVISISGISPSTAATGLHTQDNCRYLEFIVNPATICQCNAIIAVKDGEGKTMWSWHIWVTNDPVLSSPAIPVTNYAGNISNFLQSSCLGWIDPQYYDEQPQTVLVLEQEDTGSEITVTVEQPKYSMAGLAPLYQFGRKDPMRYYTTSDINGGTAGIKESILDPGAFLTSWIGSDYYNLWTGKESQRYSLADLTASTALAEENGGNLIKTIYDPSPVGYKVPSTKAFTGFTREGKKCGGSMGVYPKTDINGSYSNGWNLYTNSSKSSTIYFPIFYSREASGAFGSFALGRYRTSTVNSDSGQGSFEFQYQSSYVYPMTEKSGKAVALPVRPITE